MDLRIYKKDGDISNVVNASTCFAPLKSKITDCKDGKQRETEEENTKPDHDRLLSQEGHRK